MGNREKAKELEEKIKILDKQTEDYKNNKVSNTSYESFLKKEIKTIKNLKFNLLKRELNEDVKKLDLLREINEKLNNKKLLTSVEVSFLSLNFGLNIFN